MARMNGRHAMLPSTIFQHSSRSDGMRRAARECSAPLRAWILPKNANSGRTSALKYEAFQRESGSEQFH